jgi:hypothetical protein
VGQLQFSTEPERSAGIPHFEEPESPSSVGLPVLVET